MAIIRLEHFYPAPKEGEIEETLVITRGGLEGEIIGKIFKLKEVK